MNNDRFFEAAVIIKMARKQSLKRRERKDVMMSIPKMITGHYIAKGFIREEEREIYEYGFDITLYTIWSTAALLLLGIVLRRFVPTAIIVFGFYLFQTTGGGYHANTHLRCLTGMIAGLLFALSLESFQESTTLLWGLFIIGFSLLLVLPLVLHPNKKHLEDQRKQLAIRSLMVTIAAAIAALLLIGVIRLPLYTASAVFFLSGLSRICGRIKYRAM